MESLILHFMAEYKITRAKAEDLIKESMTDFEVMRSILKAVDRRVNNVAS